MNEWEDLQRTFAWVNAAADFYPGDRIWWIYLRGSVEKWLEWNEDPEIRAAFDRLKAFPENLPNERDHWLELRAAVEKVLGRRG